MVSRGLGLSRGGEHRADDRGCGKRREEAEDQKRATTGFAEPSRRRVGTPGKEAEVLEEACGAGEAVPAEPSEQLLGAVAGHEDAEDETGDEESEIHLKAPFVSDYTFNSC